MHRPHLIDAANETVADARLAKWICSLSFRIGTSGEWEEPMSSSYLYQKGSSMRRGLTSQLGQNVGRLPYQIAEWYGNFSQRGICNVVVVTFQQPRHMSSASNQLLSLLEVS